MSNIDRLLHEMTTNAGSSVADICQKSDVLLVFLRFFGCSFCREAISDLAAIQKNLQEKNVQLVFVHMSTDQETPEHFFERYQINPVLHIADPTCYFYREFGLSKASPGQLVSFGNWVRGFQAAVLEGHGFGQPTEQNGDGFQMPGVFFLRGGKVINSFIHKAPFDRPNYLSLIG